MVNSFFPLIISYEYAAIPIKPIASYSNASVGKYILKGLKKCLLLHLFFHKYTDLLFCPNKNRYDILKISNRINKSHIFQSQISERSPLAIFTVTSPAIQRSDRRCQKVAPVSHDDSIKQRFHFHLPVYGRAEW